MTASLEGIEAEVEQEQAARERPRVACSVAAVLADLSPDDQERLRRLIAGPAWATTIADKLAERDIELSARRIERHRRGLRGQPTGCSCRS